jgi:hypothetical protein
LTGGTDTTCGDSNSFESIQTAISTSGGSQHVAAIAGGITGAVVPTFLALTVYLKRRRRRVEEESKHGESSITPFSQTTELPLPNTGASDQDQEYRNPFSSIPQISVAGKVRPSNASSSYRAGSRLEKGTANANPFVDSEVHTGSINHSANLAYPRPSVGSSSYDSSAALGSAPSDSNLPTTVSSRMTVSSPNGALSGQRYSLVANSSSRYPSLPPPAYSPNY